MTRPRDPPDTMSLSTLLFSFLAHLGIGIALTLVLRIEERGH